MSEEAQDKSKGKDEQAPHPDRKPPEGEEAPGGRSEADEEVTAEAGAEVVRPEGAEKLDVEELKKRARERDEFLDLLRRTRAEYSNYRKRIERDRAAWNDVAVGEFVRKLLPVLDDLDLALEHADQAADLKSFAEGIRLISDKIHGILKACGVEAIVPEWERFDPAEHEAVVIEHTDAVPEQTITGVLAKGYRMHDKVLRPARVKVAKNPPTERPEEPGGKSKESGAGPEAEGEGNDADV